MNELKIELKEKGVFLRFFRKGFLEKEVFFQEDRTLSEKLLPEIDQLLKLAGVSLEEIDKVSYTGDVSEKFTSGRIVRAVVQAFNYAIKKSRNASV